MDKVQWRNKVARTFVNKPFSKTSCYIHLKGVIEQPLKFVGFFGVFFLSVTLLVFVPFVLYFFKDRVIYSMIAMQYKCAGYNFFRFL